VLTNSTTSKSLFSTISHKLYNVLRVVTEEYNNNKELVCAIDDTMVNWKIFSHRKNKQGRLPLFIALEQGVKWSDGLNEILKGYGGAIEHVDVATGLEAFMLSAAGTNTNLETVFMLLHDHPAAINPYVMLK